MQHKHTLSWDEVTTRLSADPRWAAAWLYLSEQERVNGFTLQRNWEILDIAWGELFAEKTAHVDGPFEEKLRAYYEHPVWLLNAAFTESDPATIADRLAAVRLVRHVAPRSVLDFGGGIGTVARLCATELETAERIDVLDIGGTRSSTMEYLRHYPVIRVVAAPEALYDAIISTEVLEHLVDPVGTVAYLNSLLRVGGAFSASWSFAPGIECHLPHNFHLRRLMLWIVRALGFGFYGFERRGSTVYGFVKQCDVTSRHLRQARALAALSRIPLPIERMLLLFRGL